MERTVPIGLLQMSCSDDLEANLSLVAEARDLLAHFFRDRRADSYGGLTQRYLTPR